MYKRFVEPYHKFNKSEPCDDAISREAVLKIIDKWYENKLDIEDLIILITYMSSVTQKSGKWINTADACMSDNIVCSKCGYNSIASYNYCPNCGAKMFEPQESEV